MGGLTDDVGFLAAAESGDLPLTPEVLRRYAESWKASPRAGVIDRIKTFSMLHQQTLILLNLLARRCGGHVLEVGPYIGGSTVAISTGLASVNGGKVVTVEVGGAYAHPLLPSSDIVADLEQNLQEYGVRDRVEIIAGFMSQQRPARRAIARALGRNSIGLLVIDANAMPGADLWFNETRLRDGCLLVLDDYESDGAPEKARHTRSYVERAVRRGMLEPLGIFPWGTWFGRYRRPRGFFRRMSARIQDLSDGMLPVIGKYRAPLKYARRFLRHGRLRWRPGDGMRG